MAVELPSSSRRVPAFLVLADGSVFRGYSIGAEGHRVGEVVFNTAMTGYQEILTDPSYCRQIVTLTCPHIGNVGVNQDDEEAAGVFAAGLVVRDIPRQLSNWRAQGGLPEYLEARGMIAMAGVDTRRLTRLLREKGAQNGCIWAGEENIPAALEVARAFPGLNGMDLAKEVSCTQPYSWTEGVWSRLG
ncbi:carbamoyl-phosphate synthase domain-containing protein, partial [Ferrovum sp.]|uniref:carbamoyl-phosphate synthase domain-containing protein n=1 Tax=Ferrovum sp. TaxID=2609467 RepID=UPI002620D854